MYIITTVSGKKLEIVAGSFDDAVRKAREQLEDDPEYGTLDVYRVDARGNWEHERSVTFAPDANWDTTIVVLKPGEKISAPGPVPHRVNEEDLDGYSINDPKRWALAEEIARGGWS